MIGQSPAEPPAFSFAWLLRQLRAEARLTQEELAQKAGLSPRSISDLERGISRTARKDTANLLADALAIAGPVRMAFVLAATGRAPISDVLAARNHDPIAAPAAPIIVRAGTDQSLSPHAVTLAGKLIEALLTTDGTEGAAINVILLILTARAECDSGITPPPAYLLAAP